jgi:hypothetical protein
VAGCRCQALKSRIQIAHISESDLLKYEGLRILAFETAISLKDNRFMVALAVKVCFT